MIQSQHNSTSRVSVAVAPRICENNCDILSQPQTNLEVSAIEVEQQFTNSHYLCVAEDELCEKGALCDGNDIDCAAMENDSSCIIDSLSNSISELSSSQHDSIVTAINMYASTVQAGQEQLVSGPISRNACAVDTVNDQCCSDINHCSLNCKEFFDESAQLKQADDGPKNELIFIPSSVPGTLVYPPGFEALLDAGQLVVHMGNLRHDYIFNVRCEKRMEIVNELRRVLFYAEEEPPQSERGSFLFKLYDKNKQEIAHVFCPASQTCLLCGLSWLWFKSCRFQAIVFSPPGVISGFVRQERTCLVQEFQILNAREEVILRLRGAPTDLEIYSVDLQHGIGRMSVHGWVGVMHEIRRTANDYVPVDLDVRVKGLLLASVFTIDWLYRTSGGRR